MTIPFANPNWQITDSAGDPVSGALIYTYSAGTSTPKAVFTTAALSVAHSNPVVCDAEGKAILFPGAGGYRFEVRTPAGAVLSPYSVDNVIAPASFADIEDAIEAAQNADVLWPSELVSETVTALEGETLVNLSTISYVQGANALWAVGGGLLLTAAAGDFTETSTTSVTLAQAFLEDTPLTFFAGSVVTSGVESTQVGFSAAGTGATARTVSARLRDTVSVLDFIPVSMHAAIRSGATTTVVRTYVQAALDAAGPGRGIFFPQGLYLFDQGVEAQTQQHIFGEPGTLWKAKPSEWIGTTGVLGTAPFIWNENRNTTTLTDKDITVEGIEFDYSTVVVIGGGAHAIRFRAVDRPRVINCKGTGGENLTAFLACRDSLVDECEAYNMINCWFDHWDGARGGTVRNCVGRNDSGTYIAQGLQYTGTGSALEDRDSFDFIAQGNRLYGVRGSTGQSSAIIFNTNDTGSSVSRCKSIGNYVEDADLGLVMQGDAGQHVSQGDTFRNVTMLPIYFQDDGGSPADCRVIDPTLIDCDHDPANVAMVVIEGNRNSVKGLRVVNTGAALYGTIARIVSTSTNCSVHIESAPTGSGARVANESTTGYVSDRGLLDYAIKEYPTIASAATIAPAQGVTFITGTAAIDTITPPVGVLQGGSIKLIAAAAWTTTTAGNIASTMTAVANKLYVFEYDPNLSKWYPTN